MRRLELQEEERDSERDGTEWQVYIYEFFVRERITTGSNVSQNNHLQLAFSERLPAINGPATEPKVHTLSNVINFSNANSDYTYIPVMP
jgi:hypothetical protein